MLAASRDQVVANLQAGAQDLRWRELDSIMGRYTGMIGVTSLGAGFAFSAMVELDVDAAAEHSRGWVYAFYFLIAVALVASLYVVSFSAMAIAAGNRLALQGEHHVAHTRTHPAAQIESTRIDKVPPILCHR